MLDAIQEQLEAIYGIRCEYRAKDFLVDAAAARQLGGSGRAREELLVSEGHEGLELALYVEPSLLARVSAQQPLEGELGDFCEVAEGVSHFLYMAQTASLERRVSKRAYNDRVPPPRTSHAFEYLSHLTKKTIVVKRNDHAAESRTASAQTAGLPVHAVHI
jgi:hypothetical protein